MTGRYFTFPFINSDLRDILGRLGYNPKKTELDGVTLELIEKEIAASSQFIKTAGLSVDCSIADCTLENVRLDCGIDFHSRKLASIMKNSSTATLIVCTLGGAITGEISRLETGGELSRAVILDAVASESVEAFAEYITEVLTREKTFRDQRPTIRYSPGYGDLKTDIQPEMLKVLEADKIGVISMPDSFILVP